MLWLLNPVTTTEKIGVMVVAIILFLVVMGVIMLISEAPKMPRWLPTVGYLLPAVALITFGLLWPGVLTIKDSVFSDRGDQFVGLSNFVQIFTDKNFMIVIRNTVLWMFLVPALSTAFGLAYAALVDRTKSEKLAKTLVFLPMAVSMVAASIIWKFVFEYKAKSQPQTGLLNQIVVMFGGEPQQWLLNEPLNTFMLMAVMVWIQTGFAMTVLSAAIKAISEDIIEAAKLDGATGWTLFTKVMIPAIRPSIIVVLTTVTLITLKAFDIVYTMTGGGFDTSVIANEFYMRSFRYQQPAIGAALAVLLFVIVIPIMIYNVRQLKITQEER